MSTKVEVVNVDAFIASLNVAVTVVVWATPVAPFAGVIPVTVGGGRVYTDVHPGFRARAGFWLDECQMIGVEGSFTFLRADFLNFCDLPCDANGITTRPFLDANPAISTMARSRGSVDATIGATIPPSLWPTSAIRAPSTSGRARRNATPARISSAKSLALIRGW